MLAGHGPVAVLAGGLVTVNLWLGMLATARHARMIRFGRSLNDGVFLAATLIIAVTPVGGWLTEWWLAVPLLYAYAEATRSRCPSRRGCAAGGGRPA